MKLTFSIASLLVIMACTAIAIRGWQVTRPLDHFEIDVDGVLVSKLPADTFLKIVENPDHRPIVDCEFKVSDLPAPLQKGYPRRGCVIEFWSDIDSSEQKLFSVFVDRSLFDRFRVITVKLDEPTPELKADLDFWATQKWSPNLSRRMRYHELPWWNTETKRLEPIPKMPHLIVANPSNGEIVERCRLEHEQCDFDGYYAQIFEASPHNLQDGDTLLFSVEYDSGGLFETINTESKFKYNRRRHKF